MSPIAHLVFLKISPQSREEDVSSGLAEIRSLASLVPGIRSVNAGADISIEGMQQGYTHAVLTIFDDAATRDGFISHPAHVRAVTRLEPLLEGIAILDLPL